MNSVYITDTLFDKYQVFVFRIFCKYIFLADTHKASIISLMQPDTPITEAFRIRPDQIKALVRLGINTVGDLLFHLPSRYQKPGNAVPISELEAGQESTVYGEVIKAETKKAWKKKIPYGESTIKDQTGKKIKAIWFHQPYMAVKFREGAFVKIFGKVTDRKGVLYIANPDIDFAEFGMGANTIFNQDGGSEELTLLPVYPESRGVTSGWIYQAVKKILNEKIHRQIKDPIPEKILKKYSLPALATALKWAHQPADEKKAEAARKRFAFEEIFYIQLSRQRDKKNYQSHGSFKIKTEPEKIDKFVSSLPFDLTASQKKSVADILSDLKQEKPMTRLLEGDVGSGKTAVAAVCAFACVEAGFEVAYMAPTEILARQHFETFIEQFRHMPVQIGLLTGKECRKFPSKISPTEHTHISRAQLLKWVETGQIPILIGTHALITKNVKFKKLGLVIIDEQHRFGVMQRSKLVKKGGVVPHLLSMTATPIPRTLALTIYGDLDLSLLTTMPKGRKEIVTEIVRKDKQPEVYEKIREELKAGRQAFVICPRIEEPDPEKIGAVMAKSAKAEQVRLQKNIFPEYKVGLVHSKLKPKDKEEVMADFAEGEIDILVATSVVEVGINVPNATVIIIEGAQRFGLAQLHQLRGRVMRSSHQPYCYLFTDTTHTKSLERLKALKTAKNGFELAEMDLTLRGSGSLSAGKQWGITDIGMEAIKNIKMVEAARTESAKLLETDPELEKHPLIKTRAETKGQVTHFE